MMQLGFASAILPELDLEQVFASAVRHGYSCVEVMCWPPGKASRRYAGITHIDVEATDDAGIDRIRELQSSSGVTISSLGYYPNPLSADKDEATIAAQHLRRLIELSAKLDVNRVTTFIGRDPKLSVDANFEKFDTVWPELIRHAESHDVRVGIENCPMLFTADEWPGGKNLAFSPAIWRRMFDRIPSDHFGLNYDPSHLVWMHMDEVAPLREFAGRLVHVHAKDVRVDADRLRDVGILAHPLEYHEPKLPGLGQVDWGRFFATLGDIRYDGPVCVEVEDRYYERTAEGRQASLAQSATFLRQFIPAPGSFRDAP